MKVLLLAAGRSKRMQPVEDKNFMKFLGKPLIQWQLELLHENCFDDVLVVGSAHNMDRISDIGKSLDMNVEICEQEDLELGMAGAVLSAKDKLDGPVLIFSSNDVVESKAFELLKDAALGNEDAYILGKKVTEYFPGGYLEVEDGFIKNIIEKPEPGSEPSDLVNLVVHVHKDFGKLVNYLEKVSSDKDDRYEVALSGMIKDGVKMKAVSYDGVWLPIKFPWHVRKVFDHFFEKADKGVSDSAKISKNAVINGDVIIEDGVKVFDCAVVNGPCFIGKDSIVATNALVRESNIGEKCVIGFASEVARSFLGDSVWTHSNYIGDSVLGNNISFGAGCVTGNLRLDEKNVLVDYDGKKLDTQSSKFGIVVGDNVRFGINASIMPGVKIGSGSFIGAGVVIAQNIPEKSFVRGSWDLKISENHSSVENVDRSNYKKNLDA